jgi:glycosyltransferase involved in cell wall biosynthesis
MDRIVVFGPYPPPYGGNAKHTADLARSLEEAGAKVERKRFTMDFDPASPDVQRSVTSIVRNFASVGHGDTVYDSSTFVFEYTGGYARVAFVVLKLLRRFRWIKRLHDESTLERYEQLGPVGRAFYRFALRRVDVLVLDNERARELWQRLAGQRVRIQVIEPLLPPSPAIFSTELRRGRVRRGNDERRTIVSIGAFIDRYSFREIADVVERLRQAGRNLQLVLIETSFTRSEEYVRRVIRGRDWIKVVSNLTEPELAQQLRASDVFVRGLKDESFGISRVEALWAGIPAIATKGAGAEDGILLFDPRDEDELEARLVAALDRMDPEQVERWAKEWEQRAFANRDAMLELAMEAA